MIEWTRPSGSTIETNNSDATIKYAEANGWKQKGKPKQASRKVNPKVTANDDSETDSRRGSRGNRSKDS